MGHFSFSYLLSYKRRLIIPNTILFFFGANSFKILRDILWNNANLFQRYFYATPKNFFSKLLVKELLKIKIYVSSDKSTTKVSFW